MTEWQIIESDNFPEAPTEETPRFSPRLRGFLLAGCVLIFLGLIAFVAVGKQRTENRTALQEDLAAYIFEEETHRYLGKPDGVSIVSYAPPTWQRMYWRGFELERDLPPPGAVRLSELDFDGRCAVVTAEIAGRSPQVRAYCLQDRQWQRAPVPKTAWGEEKGVIGLANGVRLVFWPRDRVFAEALAGELPLLFQKLEPWLDSPETGSLAEPNPYQGLEIVIEPHDLLPPLLADQEQQIMLNSPWLVQQQALAGETAVRLALVKSLVSRVVAVQAKTALALPGKTRFLTAIQEVAAIDSMLTPEARTDLFESWRRRLNGQWVSPFFVELLTVGYPNPNQQAELAALLTAAYIYQQQGVEGLSQLIQALPEANSWDVLFQARLNRSTIELEREAAVFSRGQSLASSAAVITVESNLSAPELPFVAALLNYDPEAPGQGRLHVAIPGRAEPLFVELPDRVSFQTTAGERIPPGCTPLQTELEIKGEWLEVQRRLQASEVTVRELTPLALKKAPADTAAYLVGRQSQNTPLNPALYNIPPILRPHYVAGPSALVETLMALRSDGVLQPLTVLSATLQVFPLPFATGEPVHFLFKLDLPTCQQSWFIHYEPTQGVTRQWLAPPAPIQWLWRADRQDLMFFSPTDSSLKYDIYETTQQLLPRPIGAANAPLLFIGWNIQTGQLVSTSSWFDEVYLGLFDLSSGRIARMTQPLYLPLRARRLSPDGNWLAYLASAQNVVGPPDSVGLLNLSEEKISTLLRVEAGEGLAPPVWSFNWEQPVLAVLAGPVVEGDELLTAPTRLLLAWPGWPNAPVMVAQASAGERLALPVFCASEGLLYIAERAGRYRLQRQSSSLQTETLLETDQPVWPLACP